MIRSFLILTFLFALLFHLIPETYTPSASLRILAAGTTGETVSYADDRRPSWNGLFSPPGPDSEKQPGTLYNWSGVLKKLEEGSLASIPFRGDGYFIYQKAGDRLTFHDKKGEILWERQIRSYPLPEPGGRLIFLLTGDGNRVDIIDRDGNPAGIQSVAGNILTDISFADRSGDACVVFATGAMVVVQNTGELKGEVLSNDDGERKITKGCALDSNGNLLAIHYQGEAQDYINIYRYRKKDDSSGFEPEYTFPIPGIVPTTVPMALSENGVMIPLDSKVLLFTLEGELLLNHHIGMSEAYRPVLTLAGNFIFHDGGRLYLVDRRGKIQETIPVPDSRSFLPMDLIPYDPDRGIFALRKGGSLVFYESGFF